MSQSSNEVKNEANQILFSFWRPDRRLNVADWSDQHRILSTVSSSESGRWRTDRTPYLRAIMNALSTESLIQEVVFMKGSQIGGTEMGLNWIGYLVDNAPGPALIAQPTELLARRFSKQRLDRLFRDTPRLKDKIRAKKSRDSGNTTILKEYDGGILMITGANSAVSLRSMPIRYLMLDEVDGYPMDVDGEGDPVELAKKRTGTFNRKKIFYCSTPNVRERSRIETLFLDSDRNYYHVPCPFCGFYQRLKWENIHWEKGKPETAYLKCVECSQHIPEHHKTKMLSNGRWVPENPEHPNKRRVGFHLSALYSPLGWTSWSELAREFSAANTPEKLKVFVNTALGETWKEKGEAPDWARLFERRETYKMNICPQGVLFLTAGVDVQKDRFEFEIVGWGSDKQSWSIDYRVIYAKTDDIKSYDLLNDLLNEAFEVEGSKHRLPIRLVALDSGYNTQTVYNYVRSQGGRVIAVKGSDKQQGIIGVPSRVDVTWEGKKWPRGVKLWPVGSAPSKIELYGWLNLAKPTEDGERYPAGYCHFPQYNVEYFKGLTAEELTIKKIRGYPRQVWEKIRERNEPLDARIYARAAACIVGLDKFRDTDWAAMREAVKISSEPSGPVPAKSNTKGGIPIKPSSFW